jgi:hypothetical protein
MPLTCVKQHWLIAFPFSQPHTCLQLSSTKQRKICHHACPSRAQPLPPSTLIPHAQKAAFCLRRAANCSIYPPTRKHVASSVSLAMPSWASAPAAHLQLPPQQQLPAATSAEQAVVPNPKSACTTGGRQTSPLVRQQRQLWQGARGRL